MERANKVNGASRCYASVHEQGCFPNCFEAGCSHWGSMGFTHDGWTSLAVPAVQAVLATEPGQLDVEKYAEAICTFSWQTGSIICSFKRHFVKYFFRFSKVPIFECIMSVSALCLPRCRGALNAAAADKLVRRSGQKNKERAPIIAINDSIFWKIYLISLIFFGTIELPTQVW